MLRVSIGATMEGQRGASWTSPSSYQDGDPLFIFSLSYLPDPTVARHRYVSDILTVRPISCEPLEQPMLP
jgi:hypothetical protein